MEIFNEEMASSLKYIVVSFGTFFCNFVSLFSIKREEPDTPRYLYNQWVVRTKRHATTFSL